MSLVYGWTVSHGVITQVKDYFNISVTVTRLGNSNLSADAGIEFRYCRCEVVWENSLSNRVSKSVPGLVLAL